MTDPGVVDVAAVPDPGVVDVAAVPDPVAAVLRAQRDGHLLSLPTSGTSGSPRRVVRDTASWWSSFKAFGARTGIGRDSTVWVPGPLNATMNLFMAVYAATVGARLVSEPAGASHAQLTTATLVRALAAGHLDPGAQVVVAGDALSPALTARAAATGVTLSHYYGAAELSFVAWGTHADDLTAFPGVDLDVRDGEIWVRSPYLARGYAGAPGPLRQTDGWASVGDRGELLDGRLLVHGRGGEAVTTAGATVLVADVEPVLVAAAAAVVTVLGVPHPDLGAVVVAVLSDPDDLAPVRACARDRLAASHRPRRWFACEEPPLTPAGKVDRAALRALVLSGGLPRLR